MSQHSQAFIYACSHPRWLPETLVSADSNANQMPQAIRILYTTRELASRLPNDSAFTDIRELDHLTHSHRPRFAAMLDCELPNAMFIDGDTFFTSPVPEVFDALSHFDIALAIAPQHFHPKAQQLGIYRRLPIVSDAIPEWNSGVIVARLTHEFRAFARHWSELFSVCQTAGYSMDQPALRSALANSRLRIATLPSNYNFRAGIAQSVKGEIKILHAHGDLRTIASTANQNLGRRFFRPPENGIGKLPCISSDTK